MAGFVKGNVVIVPFPFSDLTQTKRRRKILFSLFSWRSWRLCPADTLR